MTHRVHNFSPGPAALPLPVLEQVQGELLDFQGTGVSILESSHRGPAYDAVHNQTVADMKALLGCDDSHDVLFMGGGARSQFALVAMNLVPEGGHADYVSTGRWSELAISEGGAVADVREVWTSKPHNHDRVPAAADFPAGEGAAYVHSTSNNTIAGTEYLYDPEAAAPLVCDMSSDLLSRPVDTARYGLVYAGAQKNLGPAGVTVLIVRKDLLERCSSGLPAVFSYPKMAAKNSLLNTPPAFPIYVVGLVAKHLVERGGLEAAEARNREKAGLLYGLIDGSDFFSGHAQPDSRSRMNVTFRLPSEELEARFIREAAAEGLMGLKGHRSVGGLRASIYNAIELSSVQALAEFLQEFERTKG